MGHPMIPQSGFILEQLLAESWERYQRRLVQCRKQFNERSVHKLRIAARRLDAVLLLVGPLVTNRGIKKLRTRIKRRLCSLSPLRDSQVQRKLLAKLCVDYPELERFGRYLERRETRLRRAARKQARTLRASGLRKGMQRLQRRLAATSREALQAGGELEAVQNIIAQAFEEFKLLRADARKTELRSIHKTRLAFKRYRYMIEELNPDFVELDPLVLQEFKELQTIMGDVRDLEVLIADLDDYIRSRPNQFEKLANARSLLLSKQHGSVRAFMCVKDSHPLLLSNVLSGQVGILLSAEASLAGSRESSGGPFRFLH